MSWRPTPAERNPLLALRRVTSDVLTTVEEGTVVRLEPARDAPAGRSGGRPARRTRERAPRNAAPDRPVQALITSTPVDTAPRPAGDPPAGHAPAGPGHAPAGPGHAPAGPWSTLPDAPSSTPTLLRLSPGGAHLGSATTATGRSASVTHPRPAARRARPPRPDPSPVRPAPRIVIGPVGAAAPRLDLDELFLPIPLTLPRSGRRPMTVVQVVTASTVALSLWALADAPALLHSAETAPLGTRRTTALDVLRPLDRVSTALSIDRLSRLTDDLLHRHHAATVATDIAPPAPHPVVTRPTSTAAGPGKKAVLPPATIGPLRVGTAADPLRVLVIGDSIGLSFGDSVANKLGAGGIVKTTVDAREGTGLSRPDAFDWQAELRADVVQFHPELVVAMFGGNDDQDTIVNGRYIPFASQAWTVIYGSRVAAMADAAHAAHAHLLWSGIPVVRSAAKNQRLQSVMAVTRAALASRDAATFVDNAATLADGSGHYTDALTDTSGQAVIVREPDGIHVSPAGADILADRAIATMTADWHLVTKP